MSSSSTHTQRQGAIAVITMDHGPVNGLGLALRSALQADLARALADPGVQAIVLTGTERGFSGGADVKEFGTDKALASPRLPDLIALLEDAPKPVVAAIAGVCMGGGLELALGAHWRVARRDARIALPEVKLGLLPGAGGTQRLPRLVGLERALAFIASGATEPARQFEGSALFDALTDGDVVAEALALAQQVLADRRPLRRVRDRVVEHADPEAFLQQARQSVAAGAKGLAAPLRCVDAVGWSALKPFDEGLRLEREAFLALLASTESRALRHVFKAERAATKIDGLATDLPLRPVRRVGVIGAGTMGGGIAMNFLNAGLPVVLLETRQEALDRGLATIRRNYDNSAKKGKLKPEQVEQRLALLTPTLAYEDLAEVDLVVEAVFEDMAVKESVFRRLDEVLRPGAILATNTSYLDIDRIADFTRRPADVLGLHFFSPANVMKLLEIVRGARTAPDVLATCLALAKGIKKVAVIAGVCDGFIGNRMLARYGAAALGLVAAGATPQQVDSALQDFGMAMGPLRMGDLAGLDIGWATRKRRAAEAGAELVPGIADRLCEAGRFGQKTGAGWYRYEAGSRAPLPDPVTEQIVADYRSAHGISARAVTAQEVVERCIYALVNEAARILEQGIATRASDIDLVYLNGYGFPLKRGGPMCYADSVGLPQVLAGLQRFAAEPGADASWQPAPLLQRLVDQGRGFTD